MEISYGTAAADDREDLWRLDRQGFGGDVMPFDAEMPAADDDRIRVARVGGRPVGKVAVIGMGQWFNGGCVPMAGVTGVTTSMHVTGQGITKKLLKDALFDSATRGDVVATLYPTTASLYRSVGFEIAGSWTRRALPIADLYRGPVADITVEPAAISGIVDNVDVYERHAERNNGWLHRPQPLLRRRLHQLTATAEKKSVSALRAVRGGETIALAIVATEPSTTVAHREFDLDVEHLWGEADGLRALAGAMSGHGTIAGEMRTVLPRNELGALTDQPQRSRVVEDSPWMLRVLDIEAAMSARPNPAIGGEVHLRVHDPLISANDGPWVLRSVGGHLAAESGGTGAVQIAITDLAALYTGFQTPGFLASLGRLAGARSADLRFLGDAFLSGEPTLVHHF